MKELKSCVGIDISKDSFEVCIKQLKDERSGIYKQRQQLAEHPWGTIKRQRGFDYVLAKGKKNVLGEVGLLFLGYNLSRLARIEGGINALKVFMMQIMHGLFTKWAYLKTIEALHKNG